MKARTTPQRAGIANRRRRRRAASVNAPILAARKLVADPRQKGSNGRLEPLGGSQPVPLCIGGEVGMESGRHKQVLDQEEPEECSQDERENDHPPARLGEETIRTWSRVDSVISQILHDWS